MRITDIESKLNIDGLSEITIVSNVATYLYLSFRKDQSVLELSINHNEQDLIDTYYSWLSKERTIINKTVLYSIIIAMSFKQSSYSYGFFNLLKEEVPLKWSSDLANIFFSNFQFTQVNEAGRNDIKNNYINGIPMHEEITSI